MARCLVCPNCGSEEGFEIELPDRGAEEFVVTGPILPEMVRRQGTDEVQLDLVCKSCRVVVWAAYWPYREGLSEELAVLVHDQTTCAVKWFS